MKMKIKAQILITVLSTITMVYSAGAQTITMQQAIEYGKKHNPWVGKSALELERNNGRIREGVAGYLPQVSATGTWTDNLKLPTQIIPGAIFGQPGQDIAVQFGTKYNVSGSLDINQAIFNKNVLTGIKAAKQSRSLAELAMQSSVEDMIYNIASAYYNAQAVALQRELVQANLDKVDGLITVMNAKLEKGFAKKIDVDRLVVNKTNLQTELENINIVGQQQLLLLKFYSGMPLDTIIAVENIGSAVASTQTLDIQQTVEMNVLNTKIELADLSIEQIHSGYYPTLNANFRAAYQAQQNEFNILSSTTKWFPISYIGLNLNIPIFDGLLKSGKSQQAEVDKLQLQFDKEILQRQQDMKRTNAKNTLALKNTSVGIQQRNLALAEEVYQTTQTQYQGGIISISEVLNAETSLREAQSNYTKAILDTQIADLDVLRSTGNLLTLTR